MQIHILAQRLRICFYLNQLLFLRPSITNRSQRDLLENSSSDSLVTSTGSSKGCAPFTLMTVCPHNRTATTLNLTMTLFWPLSTATLYTPAQLCQTLEWCGDHKTNSTLTKLETWLPQRQRQKSELVSINTKGEAVKQFRTGMDFFSICY